MKSACVFLLSIGICTLCLAIVPDEYGVSGSVWCDVNGNSIWEMGEPGLAGVTVQILSSDGVWIDTATTDNTGSYVFTVPGPDTYTIWINRPATSRTVTVTKREVVIAPGFGLPCPQGCTGRIGDYVWLDINGDGIQDDDEFGIPNVKMLLKDEAGAALAATWTDTSGKYSFAGLCPATYTVEVEAGTVDTQLVPSPCVQGMDQARDSNCRPVTVTLTGDHSEDLTLDFGYYPRSGEEICTEDPAHPGHTIPMGTLTAGVDGNGDVTVVFEESRNINDNSYGVNAVGWAHGHKFTDLVNSDKAEFLFKDATGKKVFDFYLDYISAKTGTPSGYACLGVSGGEGKVLTGQAAWLLAWDSSLAQNLNDYGLCTSGNCTTGGVNLIANSPPTSPAGTYIVPLPLADWEFSIIYRVTVSHLAFGSAGFGSVTIPLAHNSPPKNGVDKPSQIPCEPTTPPTSDCGVCKGGVTQLTLQYTGASAALVTVYAGTKPQASNKLFEDSVASGGQFTFTGIRSDLTMGTNISLYVNGLAAATIHTSCSQPIGPGLVKGDFKVLDGASKDGGKLCAVP